MAPTILFEDTHLIVLDKPAGMLSQGDVTGDGNLVDWLRQYLGRPYVGLIHRLDRGTSGVMVVAKRSKAANRLTESLQAGRLTRTYVAWLEGLLSSPARWRHFLKKDEVKNLVRVVRGPGNGAKEAVLTVEPSRAGLWLGQTLTLATFVLETGRSHQIRAQAAYEGHPLLGDLKYGSKTSFGRPALHSLRLRLDHPMSGEWMEFEAEMPEDMRSIG